MTQFILPLLGGLQMAVSSGVMAVCCSSEYMACVDALNTRITCIYRSYIPNVLYWSFYCRFRTACIFVLIQIVHKCLAQRLMTHTSLERVITHDGSSPFLFRSLHYSLNLQTWPNTSPSTTKCTRCQSLSSLTTFRHQKHSNFPNCTLQEMT